MTPKQLVRKWSELFNTHDASALAALYADDAVNHQTPEEPVQGRAAIEKMFADGFATFPQMKHDIVNLFEDGEWAILEWIDPRGFRGCGFFHVQNGKITSQRGYWDKKKFLELYARS